MDFLWGIEIYHSTFEFDADMAACLEKPRNWTWKSMVLGRGEESHSGQSSDEPGIRGIWDLPNGV